MIRNIFLPFLNKNESRLINKEGIFEALLSLYVAE